MNYASRRGAQVVGGSVDLRTTRAGSRGTRVGRTGDFTAPSGKTFVAAIARLPETDFLDSFRSLGC